MSYVQNETQINSVPVKQDQQPIVFVQNGEVFANSRDVAAYFGKQHRNIVRDIEKLIAERVLKFEQTVVYRENPSGGASIKSKAYNMDRDGFTLLAMSFSGKKALRSQHKIKSIQYG